MAVSQEMEGETNSSELSVGMAATILRLWYVYNRLRNEVVFHRKFQLWRLGVCNVCTSYIRSITHPPPRVETHIMEG